VEIHEPHRALDQRVSGAWIRGGTGARRRALDCANVTNSALRRACATALVAVALGLGGLTGCGGGSGGSNTDCSVNGCTVTFPRTGNTEVSVLGVSARLLGVENDVARIEVAGQTVSVPVGGQTQAGGFAVGVERVTDTEVVVRVTAGG
jgi:hypothetical protein